VTERIESPANERIKGLVRLRKRRERDRTGEFLIEGYREVARALDGDVAIPYLFVCPELFLGGNEDALVDRARTAGTTIVEVAEDPFAKASYRDRPDGLIAVAEQFDTGLERVPLDRSPLVLVAESIEKPGNLGTMIRTAVAAGGDALIVADPTTDPFNPNVVRASIGHLFTVPVAVAGSADVIDFLRSGAVTIVATTPDGDRSLFAQDLTGPVALVVGSEQYGLSDTWLDAADVSTVIPMPGPVDSLNAAMAAGIALFEAVRQRAE
jgi:TrmH family RNA methyltransferase